MGGVGNMGGNGEIDLQTLCKRNKEKFVASRQNWCCNLANSNYLLGLK